jgi:hypothetical protein
MCRFRGVVRWVFTARLRAGASADHHDENYRTGDGGDRAERSDGRGVAARADRRGAGGHESSGHAGNRRDPDAPGQA